MAPDEPGSDIGSFEEWVEQTAAARDLSDQELIDRMMSSYWILDELTGMLEENQTRTRGEGSSDRRATEERGQRDQDAADGSVDRELIELLNALVDDDAEPNRRQERAPDDREAFLEALRELADDRGSSRPPEEAFTQQVEGLREAIDRLGERTAGADDRRVSERRLRRLSEQVTDLEAELDDRFETLEERIEEDDDERERAASKRRVRRLSNQVSTLEDELDERLGVIEERVDGEIEGLSATVAELREAVEELDTRVKDSASQQQVAELSRALDALEEELSGRVRDLESDVDGELDSVEEILKYLLRAVDDLEDETDSLRTAYGEVRPVLEDYDEAGRLREITDTANQAGIGAAECEDCNNEVDIGLLRRPTCPHCDSTFDGLSTRSRLWWTSGTLTTGDPGDDPLPTREADPPESSGDAGGTDRPDFDFIEE